MKMKGPSDFEHFEGYASFRPSGNVSFRNAVGIIAKALSLAAGNGISHLLVDTTKLTGFPYPETYERYFMATEWANHSRGLRLAVIARPELIDPYRFGVTVARNRGLISDVFTAEPEAIEWLLHVDPQ